VVSFTGTTNTGREVSHTLNPVLLEDFAEHKCYTCIHQTNMLKTEPETRQLKG